MESKLKIKVTQENLNKALSTVAKVAGGRSTLPILNNVLFQIEDNRLSLSATNLDIAIKEYVSSKIDSPGALTIPARLIQDYVSNLPKTTISIEQDEHKFKLKAENYESVVNGVPADEFPMMPHIKDGKTWEISAKELKKALSQVVFAASSDEARPVLTGVFVHSDGKQLYVAATDSYRLAEKSASKFSEEVSLLIPASAMHDLLRVLTDDIEKIEVTNDSQQVLFRLGNIELVARLIEGKYPDYQKLIPKDFAVSAEVSRDELINIAKVSSLFAREAAGSITVSVDEDTGNLNIRSVASQVGENTSSTNAKAKGSGDITLNSRYLLDGLQAIDSENIVFGFNGKLDPIVLRAADDKSDYTHVIMPLKS